MANYDNTNRGVLFRNDKKQDDKQPDYKGTINVNGVEFWLSGWKKQTKDGDPMLSLSVTPKETQRTPQPKQTRNDDPF